MNEQKKHHIKDVQGIADRITEKKKKKRKKKKLIKIKIHS